MYPFLEPVGAMVHCAEPVVRGHAVIGGEEVYPGWWSRWVPGGYIEAWRNNEAWILN